MSRRSPHPRLAARSRRPLRRLPMTLAVGTLALAAAVVPAIASDTLGDSDESGWSRQDGNGDNGDRNQQTGDGGTTEQQGGDGGSSNQQGGGDWNQQTGGGNGGGGNDEGWDNGNDNGAGGGDGGGHGNGGGGDGGGHGNSGGGNGGGGGGGGGNGNNGNNGRGNNDNDGRDNGNNSRGDNDNNGRGGDGHGDHARYRGVITAPSLALRTAPDRNARVIRYARKGHVVSVHCKVGGDSVQGNPLWYLVTDGKTWAWGAARHIDNIGPAPRWC